MVTMPRPEPRNENISSREIDVTSHGMMIGSWSTKLNRAAHLGA